MRLFAALTVAAALTLSATLAQADWSTWQDPGKDARRALFQQRFLDHFTFGQDAPVTWLDETFVTNGAMWDAKVNYLSGGAARPDVSPPVDPPFWIKYSDFPTVSIEQCKAAKHPCIPWFTYYSLAQSYPANYGDGTVVSGGPANATPYNAKLPNTMRAYFEQFKYLMQKCAAQAPYPVVVHIEPDEWGHLLLSGTYTWPTLDPTTVDVKVGSTGMPELAGFPDNEIGFARAFKKLRDTYAPSNVLLITNPSAWDGAPGHSMSGTNFGNIMKTLCGDWEGAVLETGDRDKGMAAPAQVPPYVDANNVPAVSILGNFDNHIQWVHDFHQASGLPVFVWQAAAGNTYFRTCNNTSGHMMDNLAQTLFEGYPQNPTIGRYAQAGGVGWMFNAGQGPSTHVWDSNADGVTNPTPLAGNAGNTSTYADDDGGYMRLRGAAYYAHPYLLSAPTASAAADGGAADGGPGAPRAASPGATGPAATPGDSSAPGTENGSSTSTTGSGLAPDAGGGTGAGADSGQKGGCAVGAPNERGDNGPGPLAFAAMVAFLAVGRPSRRRIA